MSRRARVGRFNPIWQTDLGQADPQLDNGGADFLSPGGSGSGAQHGRPISLEAELLKKIFVIADNLKRRTGAANGKVVGSDGATSSGSGDAPARKERVLASRRRGRWRNMCEYFGEEGAEAFTFLEGSR